MVERRPGQIWRNKKNLERRHRFDFLPELETILLAGWFYLLSLANGVLRFHSIRVRLLGWDWCFVGARIHSALTPFKAKHPKALWIVMDNITAVFFCVSQQISQAEVYSAFCASSGQRAQSLWRFRAVFTLSMSEILFYLLLFEQHFPAVRLKQ